MYTNGGQLNGLLMSREKKNFLNASQYCIWAVKPAARFQASNKRFVSARFDRARRVTQRVIGHNKHSRGKTKIAYILPWCGGTDDSSALSSSASCRLQGPWIGVMSAWLSQSRASCCAFSASRVCLRASWSPVCGFPAWRAAWRVTTKGRMRRYACAQSKRAWKRKAPII